jgi:hypothetical protein
VFAFTAQAGINSGTYRFTAGAWGPDVFAEVSILSTTTFATVAIVLPRTFSCSMFPPIYVPPCIHSLLPSLRVQVNVLSAVDGTTTLTCDSTLLVTGASNGVRCVVTPKLAGTTVIAASTEWVLAGAPNGKVCIVEHSQPHAFAHEHSAV